MRIQHLVIGLIVAILYPLFVYYLALTFFPDQNLLLAPGVRVAGTPATLQQIQEPYLMMALMRATILIPAGMLAMVVGLFFRLPAIGAGVMLGGLISYIMGFSATGMSNAFPPVAKALVLLATLVILGIVATYRIKRNQL